MEGPVGEFDGAQGEVVLVGRGEKAEYVPGGSNQDYRLARLPAPV